MSYFQNPYEVYVFIALALVLVAWRIYKQIQSTYQHVDEEVLEDFWRNRLHDGKEVTRVKNHLTHCEACRDRLNAIRKQSHTRPDAQRLITRKF